MDIVDEPPGDNCANGGVAIFRGLDENDDGTLQEGERDGDPQYICNGAAPVRQGDVMVTDQDDADALADVDRIQGNLLVVGTDIGELDLGNLTAVGGNVEISTNGALETLDLASLARVGGSLDIDDNPSLATLRLGALNFVGGYFHLGWAPDLNQAGFDDLAHVGDAFIVSTGSGAALDAGLVPRFVGQSVYVGDNPGLLSLSINRGTFVGGDFVLNGNPGLVIARILGQLVVGLDLYVTNNAGLRAATVDNFVDAAEVGFDTITGNNGQ